MITIKIRTGDAAIQENGPEEVARILRSIAKTFEDSYLQDGTGSVRDYNGNTIGSVVVSGINKPVRAITSQKYYNRKYR